MDISNILTNLNEEDMSKLKSMASSLFGGMDALEKKEDIDIITNNEEDENTNAKAVSLSKKIPADFTNIIADAGKVLNAEDERCDFLISLKPFLKEERQIRVDHAIKMLRLMNMLPMLKESGFLNSFF